MAEIVGSATEWLPVWKQKWAQLVKAPVMFALVEDDPVFEADEQEVERCVSTFKNSVRVEGSLLRGAPYCVELGLLGTGVVCAMFWVCDGVFCELFCSGVDANGLLARILDHTW